ncbi:MAG: thiamine pyrophosphate-binding protein [Pseudomonadota bacterium]
MIRVADYIANTLAQHNDTAKTVFMVSGGGNMHLIDALGKHDGLEYVCNHHEQACTFATEGYARLSNKIGIAYVTTGPGGTNAITGVYSAWVDSIPTLTISGQVKFQTTIASQLELNLRQLGDQEGNIIAMVKPITKYAVMITDKNSVRFHLEKALYEAKHGRPGPVWLDIPLDIQSAMIEESDLVGFISPPKSVYDTKITDVVAMLHTAKRPVIIAGNGIVLANAREQFLELIEKLQIPVVSSFARYDMVNDDHPFGFGRFGTIGHRSTNFIVQNSDLIIAIGARLNIRAISYNWEYFGREAQKIVVDIDPAELEKHTLSIDVKINADAKIFISDLKKATEQNPLPSYEPWVQRCRVYREDFPTIIPERRDVKDFVDSYFFFHTLSDIVKNNEVFVFANATASVSSYQSLVTKGNQRIIENSGCAAMGYDLPAAIGACLANNRQSIVCVTGEGSLQMNLQELQTIIHYNLPIKLFVLNNNGYSSIRNTQNNFFNGFRVGSDIGSGVSFPDIGKISMAYGFKTFKIENQDNLLDTISKIYNENEQFICEVMIDSTEKMEPKLSSKIKADGTMMSAPLEDMYPFLERDVFKRNMIIKPMGE